MEVVFAFLLEKKCVMAVVISENSVKKYQNLCHTINSKSQTSNHNVLHSALLGMFVNF
jgi:hypothetical protein